MSDSRRSSVGSAKGGYGGYKGGVAPPAPPPNCRQQPPPPPSSYHPEGKGKCKSQPPPPATEVHRPSICDGDWWCQRCGGHNYSNRMTCYRCTHERAKPVEAGGTWNGKPVRFEVKSMPDKSSGGKPFSSPPKGMSKSGSSPQGPPHGSPCMTPPSGSYMSSPQSVMSEGSTSQRRLSSSVLPYEKCFAARIEELEEQKRKLSALEKLCSDVKAGMTAKEATIARANVELEGLRRELSRLETELSEQFEFVLSRTKSLTPAVENKSKSCGGGAEYEYWIMGIERCRDHREALEKSRKRYRVNVPLSPGQQSRATRQGSRSRSASVSKRRERGRGQRRAPSQQPSRASVSPVPQRHVQFSDNSRKNRSRSAQSRRSRVQSREECDEESKSESRSRSASKETQRRSKSGARSASVMSRGGRSERSVRTRESRKSERSHRSSRRESVERDESDRYESVERGEDVGRASKCSMGGRMRSQWPEDRASESGR